ncbi:MAG: hypothetical protein KAS38_22740, partial [Anaerolineales bacterium]|nr:hypothetical protein [Anaerolineales bacterium]
GIVTACNSYPPIETTSTPEVTQQNSTVVIPTQEPAFTPTSTKPSTETLASPSPTPSPTIEVEEIVPVIEHIAEGEEATITTIRMIDDLAGWGVGNAGGLDDHILRTRDGGRTWHDITPPEPASVSDENGKRVLSFFLDEDHGWVTYYPEHDFQFEPSLIWYTSDGGESWNESSPLDASGLDTFFEPRWLYFTDEHFGWLMLGHDRGVGHAPISIYRTGDGGRNWDRVIDPFSEENSGFIQVCCQSGMVFTDSKTGLITSQDGPIESAYVDWTNDGGLNWQEQMLPPADPDLFSRAWCGTRSPVALSSQTVALVVECLDADSQPALNKPFLYISEDGGQNWSFYNMPVPPLERGSWDYLQRTHWIDFLTPDEGWTFITDYYQPQGDKEANTLTHIYNTKDGGKSWQPIKTVAWFGQFSYVDLLNGWAAAFSGDDNALVRTINEGRTWQIITPEVAH